MQSLSRVDRNTTEHIIKEYRESKHFKDALVSNASATFKSYRLSISVEDKESKVIRLMAKGRLYFKVEE